jgi:hypothetical protein
MIYSESPDADQRKADIANLIQAAISGDVIDDADGGFIAVMAKSNPNVRQDIPAAFEMYTVLSHYLEKLPFYEVAFNADLLLTPAIFCDKESSKLVALLPVQAGDLDLIAYWIAGGIRSDTVRKMGGVLALPFTIETHSEVRHLIPEWFAAFYVGGNEDHCVPSLTMRSITLDDRFGDWVAIAVERMTTFGLPNAAASSAIKHKTATSRHNSQHIAPQCLTQCQQTGIFDVNGLRPLISGCKGVQS